MPPAAAIAVGVVAGAMQAHGARQQAKKQNQLMQNAYNENARWYDPQQVRLRAKGMNPWLYGALGGQAGNNPFQRELYNIVSNPGYMDPRLMALPNAQIDAGMQNNLQRAQALIGRSGGEGGVSNAYALANMAAGQGQKAEVGQNFALAREDKRRQDLAWLAQMEQQSMQNALQGAQGAASGTGYLAQQVAPMGWMGIGGNAIQGGLGAMSGLPMGMMGGGAMGGASRGNLAIGSQASGARPSSLGGSPGTGYNFNSGTWMPNLNFGTGAQSTPNPAWSTNMFGNYAKF